MHVGALGDSRAVLAVPVEPASELASTVPIQSENRFARPVYPSQAVKCLALSQDHRPDDPVEYERIINAGGRVKQLADEAGKGVGPYRVWDPARGLPGLAMSRSLGDGIAKSLGVSATPVVESERVPLNSFIVLASDGVWNAMSGQEVINFVEAFRHKACTDESADAKYPLVVRSRQVENATIAHLLAEEARHRWFAMCEEDSIGIDDIGVSVLEFSSLS